MKNHLDQLLDSGRRFLVVCDQEARVLDDGDTLKWARSGANITALVDLEAAHRHFTAVAPGKTTFTNAECYKMAGITRGAMADLLNADAAPWPSVASRRGQGAQTIFSWHEAFIVVLIADLRRRKLSIEALASAKLALCGPRVEETPTTPEARPAEAREPEPAALAD